MKKAATIRLVAGIFALLLIAAGLWMIYSTPSSRPSAALSNLLKEPGLPSPNPAVKTSTSRPELAAPAPPARTANPAPANQTAGQPRSAADLVKEFDKLFAAPPAGLTANDAKDLMARRKQARQDLVDQLSALGPGGARSMADVFKQTGSLRDRQLLAQALGKVQDSDAVDALKELLANQTGFYERQSLITALAHRTETTAIEPLAGVLSAQSPGGLQFAAVQGLSGRADALPILSATIEDGTDAAVRLEAIHSVGLIGNDAAKAELVSLAEKSSLQPIIRETAIQELRRSFGSSAQDVLQALSNDAEPAIRGTATQALAMLHH